MWRIVNGYSLQMQVFILPLQFPQTWKSKTHGVKAKKKDYFMACIQRQEGKKRAESVIKLRQKNAKLKKYCMQMPDGQTAYSCTTHAQTLPI